MNLDHALALAPKVRAITDNVLSRHIGRADVANTTWLSLVSGRPVFFLGSPGVDKTGTIQALARRIQGAVFYDALMPTIVSGEQLLVESTSIEEIALPNGGKQIRTHDELGRAAAAHVFFAELPDPEGNLGAVWSRMTIRVAVNPLDRAGKIALVKARLARDRASNTNPPVVGLTLGDVEALRSARPQVEVPDDIVNTALDILQELVDDTSSDFKWAWADDRRFGRLFDIMQAQALLDGRRAVAKQDLGVLEWLLWDTPEQIPAVKAKVAPYCRTPLHDAEEAVNALLSPAGTVALVQKGDRSKGVQAITQCEACFKELDRLKGEATDDAMRSAIADLATQVVAVKEDVIAVVTGIKKGGS